MRIVKDTDITIKDASIKVVATKRSKVILNKTSAPAPTT